MKKIIPILMMILMSMLVYSIVTVEYIGPIDEFYLIKGSSVMGNITFEVNATPTGATGNITNITLWTNISGSWTANFTNATASTIATETNRIFPNLDTSINSRDLSDGLVFIWNAYACDNISIFYNEDVSLDSDVFTIFDNYTNTTGDGFCIPNASCLNAHIITAGRGRVSNYPLSSIDDVANTTGEGLPGSFKINGSVEGYFYVNQTKKNYNGTDGLISTETIATSSVKVNYTISSTCRFIGSNRTVYVEDAPNVTLNSPSDSEYSTSSTLTINYTVIGDDSTYLCYVYSNDTGSWTQEAGASTATNNTYKLTSKVFTEGHVLWNVRCSESTNSNIYGWSTSNFTVKIDETNPAITINSPTNDSYVKYVIATDTYAAKINITVVDVNADSCTIKVNGTVNRSYSYTSGTHFALNFNATDGNYNWNLNCSDSSGRTAETANRTITLDTVMPTLLRNVNYTSSAADCEGFTVDFNFSEIVNATFTWGTSSMAQTHSLTETDFSINQTFTLTFNNTYETDYFANVSISDRSGNLNNSFSEMTITSPIPLCTGWSLWSIYDTAINLSDYRAASGADYVYYWNNTGQSWIYSTAVGSSQENYNMRIGDVVQLYESTNTTYFRNNTGTPTYTVNITGGHTYFGLYHAYTFGNISYNIFKNESGGNVTSNSTFLFGAGGSAGGLDFGDITYFSGFNNSNQQYIDAPYLWLWNNASTLGPSYLNGLDTLWAYVNYNLSINFTPDGFVLGNWT